MRLDWTRRGCYYYHEWVFEEVRMASEVLSWDYIKQRSVTVPETVFPLGADYAYLDEETKKKDRLRRLNMDNLLASTPIVWTHVGEFRIGQFMVTNREYAIFVQSGIKNTQPINYNSWDLWEAAWSELYRISQAETYYKTVTERVEQQREDYQGCRTFVDAYVDSLRYEMRRVVERTEGRVALPEEELYERVFAFVKYRLRNVIASADTEDIFAWGGSGLTSPYSDMKEFRSDLGKLVKASQMGYTEMADAKTRSALQKGAHIVEPLVFLRRFVAACKQIGAIDKPIPLHMVLYPRDWDSPEGKHGGAAPGEVHWLDRPVVWVTLYESLAFCIWLTKYHHLDTRRGQITLPNEAEYECAATWTPEPLEGKTEIRLDPRKKSVLPWLDRHKGEFHQYFGMDGTNLYAKKWFNNVMEKTARHLNDERIYQLVGFGGQWTIDRYKPGDSRYQHLLSPGYPRYGEIKCLDEEGKKELDVIDFHPYQSEDASLYIVRGCSEITGGPGLATRRFAFYPLRGYAKTGFRWVIKG